VTNASRHQRRIEAARQLRDRLKAEGRTTDARVVDELARSSAVSMGTNRNLQEQLQYVTERLRLSEIAATAHLRALKETTS
jgi:hypothetical protein